MFPSWINEFTWEASDFCEPSKYSQNTFFPHTKVIKIDAVIKSIAVSLILREDLCDVVQRQEYFFFDRVLTWIAN